MTIRSLVLAVALGLAVGQDADWRTAARDFAWTFPRDHWSHPGYKTEWWYFTGHVLARSDPARQFAYQFTFFRVGIVPERPALPSAWTAANVVMGHLALTDPLRGEHVFSEVLYRDADVLGGFGEPPDPRIAWSRGPPGTEAPWSLFWNGSGFDFSAGDDAKGLRLALSTRPVKPLVFQGPNGYSAKQASGDAASLYYSLTRLATTGQVTFAGETWDVTGTSWMDKEFGSNQLSPEQVGWDWFSLQLDDGRDVMLYLLRTKDRIDYAHGTLVAPDGSAAFLDRTHWRVEALESTRSPHTGARYPSRWRIFLPADTLDVTPILVDQENVSTLVDDLYYWEGGVGVHRGGTPFGQGFVELTGYGAGSRPAI